MKSCDAILSARLLILLGADFHISTPKVIEGVIETTRFKLSPRCFVLPFRWKSNVAELIISVES